MIKQFLIDVRIRLKALFGRDRLHDRVSEELRFHVGMIEEKLIASGVPPEVARVRARRQLGNSTLIQEKTLDALMACQIEPEPVPVRVGGSEAEETLVQMVSSEYFTTLGVPALLGRTLTAGDHPSAPHAVISYDYWQRRFGRRADVLGRTITIRQGVFSIIGVAPPSFFGETVGQRPDVWVPLILQPVVLPGREWLHENAGGDKVMWLHVFGRLQPGVRMETAQASANVRFRSRSAWQLWSWQVWHYWRRGFPHTVPPALIRSLPCGTSKRYKYLEGPIPEWST